MTTTLSAPSSRIRNLPGSSTAETWPTQIQPRKIWSISQSSTAWSAKAAGGSIVARSTGCASARPRAGRGRRAVSGRRRHHAASGLIDLVVNRMLAFRRRWRSSRRPNPRRSTLRGRSAPAGARPAVRRGRADPARGGGRGARRQAPGGDDRRGQARRGRGRARRRHARGRARRPGLDAARVGAGRGAVRAHDQRDPLARAERLQRLGARLATSRSTATCARRCAASSRTPTRSPSATPAPTPRGSRRPPSAPTAASGSTARSGSSPPATTPPSTS